MVEALGWPELLIIRVIILLLVGGKKLLEVGSSPGRAISEFKRGLQGDADNDSAPEKLADQQ